MSSDLVRRDPNLPAFGNQSFAAAENQLARYTSRRDAADILREAAKQLAAEYIQAGKTMNAQDLEARIYEHFLSTADRFSRQAFALLEAPGRSAACQDYFAGLFWNAMDQYAAQVHGIREMGVAAIARELLKDLVPDKRGFWARLFG